MDTPPQPALDTNILRVNNINNNTYAREFKDKTYTINFTDKNNNTDKSVHTNSAEIKTLNIEEKKSSYADLASCSLVEQKQSAFIATNIIS